MKKLLLTLVSLLSVLVGCGSDNQPLSAKADAPEVLASTVETQPQGPGYECVALPVSAGYLPDIKLETALTNFITKLHEAGNPYPTVGHAVSSSDFSTAYWGAYNDCISKHNSDGGLIDDGRFVGFGDPYLGCTVTQCFPY